MRSWHGLVLLAVVLTLVSCGKPEDGSVAAPKKVREAPETFTYSDTPAVEMIPNGAIQAVLGGKPFEYGMVYIVPGLEGWQINVIEKKHEDPTDAGFGDDGQEMYLEFSKDHPEAGQVYTKAMEPGGGMVSCRVGEEIENWSGPNAYAIEITKWDVKPYTEDLNFSVAGHASGYMAICFENDKEDIGDSWAAGEFVNIPVLYQGAPFWTEE